MSLELDSLTALLIGIFLGIGSLTYFLGRFDRQYESGCFYNLIVLLIVSMIAAIALGSLNG